MSKNPYLQPKEGKDGPLLFLRGEREKKLNGKRPSEKKKEGTISLSYPERKKKRAERKKDLHPETASSKERKPN